MELINGFFQAVWVWSLSGICAIVLKRVCENIFKKIKIEKFSRSLFPKLITNLILWIPILIAFKIEWSDQYAIAAGFTIISGFIVGIFPYDLKYKSGVFIFLVLLGLVIFDVSGLESHLEKKIEFIIIASTMALGYLVGDFTRKSRVTKNV